VTTNNDTRPEWNENFYVLLSMVGSGSNYATIVDGTGEGTIIDNDESGPVDAHLILHKAHCNCSWLPLTSNTWANRILEMS
jgi:hypothetical protein